MTNAIRSSIHPLTGAATAPCAVPAGPNTNAGSEIAHRRLAILLQCLITLAEAGKGRQAEHMRDQAQYGSRVVLRVIDESCFANGDR